MCCRLTITLIALLLGFGQVVAQFLSPGVSHDLALRRAQQLSDISYNLTLQVPPDVDAPVEGKVNIMFTLKERQDVVLDFQGELDSLPVQVNRRNVRLFLEDEHIVVPRHFVRKGKNVVTVCFKCSDQALNRHDDFLYTLFVPDHARSCFPCFDQPDLKAFFHLDLRLPEGWVSISSDEQHPLPTYLFSFTAGRFRRVEAERDGRRLTLLHRETDSLKVAQLPQVFDEMALSLQWLEQYTGISYPFTDYGVVVLPGYQFGGMEHPGAIQLNANTIFLPPSPTPDEEIKRLKLIAHETSHMWFGDLVTMRWFNDVWTKEVFANLMAAKIAEEQFPDVNHDLNFLKTYLVAALQTDRTPGTHPIQQPLENLNQAGLLYGNIIYDKAPVMMRKLEELVGQDAFRRGLQDYLKRYSYANATWDDLMQILDSVSPQAGVGQFSEVWVKQRGMPYVRTEWRAGKLRVGQHDVLERSLVWKQKMKVGVETMQGMRVVDVDMQDSVAEVIFGERPRRIIANYDGRGYGRFEDVYIDSLPTGDATHRYAQMMLLYENVLMGRQTAEQAVDMLIDALQREDNPLVASTACSYLSGLLSRQSTTNDSVEQRLYDLAGSHPLKPLRQQLLRYLGQRAASSAVLQRIRQLWEEQNEPLLSERDYINMAYHLAIMQPKEWQSILERQRARLSNADLLREFDYVSRACNPSQSAQDSLLHSLADVRNRVVEPWTCSLLSLLNSPERASASERFITPALELLPEIQQTGGIFFPSNWLAALLAHHHSRQARQLVDAYLGTHPELSEPLRRKILEQAYYIETN